MSAPASVVTAPAHRQRSILLHGLWLLLKRPRPILWAYVANVGTALAFTAALGARLSDVLDHSLAAERLNSAFDLGTLGTVFMRLSHNAPSTGISGYLGVPLYLLIYFIIVPGSLFCYAADAPCRLSIILSTGVSFFWRFVRITLLTLLVSGIVLGPLLALQTAFSAYVDEHIVGWASYYDKLPGLILIVLVASVLRLYFDLVEVYTVQMNEHLTPAGKTDRRIRKVLLPAWRTLRQNFGTLYLSWMALLLVGLAASVALSRVAIHSLAQPRAWPIFLLTQAALLVPLITRFWQRAAETVLALDHPLLWPVYADVPPADESPYADKVLDAEPNPEPPVPSLDAPDPGIFEPTIPPA